MLPEALDRWHLQASSVVAAAVLQARVLLSKVGGIVHHVHMEAGGRVSYKPYRDVSKALISRLRQFAGVGIIEKASIDEAYILFRLQPEQQAFGTMTVMQQAAQLARTIRQAGALLTECMQQQLPSSSRLLQSIICWQHYEQQYCALHPALHSFSFLLSKISWHLVPASLMYTHTRHAQRAGVNTVCMAVVVRQGHQAGACCAAVLQELSLVTSVGIASNKMVAKLASQASKPDGILVVDGPAALQSLLKATPAARLPRCGGKVTDTLVRAGIHTVADLQVCPAGS